MSKLGIPWKKMKETKQSETLLCFVCSLNHRTNWHKNNSFLFAFVWSFICFALFGLFTLFTIKKQDLNIWCYKVLCYIYYSVNKLLQAKKAQHLSKSLEDSGYGGVWIISLKACWMLMKWINLDLLFVHICV